MRALRLRKHLSAHYVVAIVLLSLYGLVFLGLHSEGREVKGQPARVKKMVDAIANRNNPPVLLKIDHPQLSSRIPLFPEGFDWEEQSRVRSALAVLYQDTTEALWEELVLHENDPRYSLTVADNGGLPDNYTVGRFCYTLAYSRLVDVFRRHIPYDEDDRPIVVDIWHGDYPCLRSWRNERKQQPLYQLQIEVCEKAIKQVPNVTKLSTGQKVIVRKKIQSEVDKLKQTRQPVLLKSTVTGLDLYTPEWAKGIRDKIRVPAGK